jgi:hypothetical protein
MNEIDVVSVNKDAKSLLDHLFYDKIIQFGSRKNEDTHFVKQVEIKKLRDKVVTFIERNPNSEFEIRLLNKNNDNKEDFRVSLIFRNYKNEPDSRVHRFLIVIDYVMNNATFYEWAINNVLLSI